MRAVRNEPMKTISARIPTDDAELFELICEEYQVTQSEAIRSILQAFVAKTFDTAPHPRKQIALSFKELKNSFFQDNPNQFYEHFKVLNRTTAAKDNLKVGNL